MINNNCIIIILSGRYLMAPRGEIYGIDHTLARFSPEAVIALRPETPIKVCAQQ